MAKVNHNQTQSGTNIQQVRQQKLNLMLVQANSELNLLAKLDVARSKTT